MGALIPAAPLLTLGALPLMEPLDQLASDVTVSALLQVHVAGFRAERPVGVDDLVALAVLHDPSDSLPPGALPLDGGRRVAELAQPPGPLQLDCPLVDPTAPGELAGLRPVGAEQVGVPLVPGQVLLLNAAGLPLPVGVPVGLLTGELGRGLGQGVVVAGLGQLPAAQQPPGTLAQLGHPVAGPLLAGGRFGQPLLSVPALLSSVGQQPTAVRWGVAQQGGHSVALGAQLPLAHLPQRRPGGGVDGQALAAVPAGNGGQLVVHAAGFEAGDVQLQLDRPGLGADDVEEGRLLGGAGGGHIEPLAVFNSGHPHQGPVQGYPWERWPVLA